MNDLASLVVSKVPSNEEIQFLDGRIYEYNSLKTGKADGKSFSKWIYERENNVIAGLSGWTWANACEITFLWVKDEHGKKGYGQLLLSAAEAEAKKNNCNIILIRSYDFQAPLYYQKHGYQVEHKTEGFPPEHSSYWLVKRFND
jgi:GNAT superfamily N-acetyltransferase